MKVNPRHDRRIRACSFNESYQTTVQVIHPDNFLRYIPTFTLPAV